MGEKLLKIPFLILQFTKKAEKAIFWSRIQTFFCKRCSLRLQTFLSYKTLFQTCWDTLYVFWAANDILTSQQSLSLKIVEKLFFKVKKQNS